MGYSRKRRSSFSAELIEKQQEAFEQRQEEWRRHMANLCIVASTLQTQRHANEGTLTPLALYGSPWDYLTLAGSREVRTAELAEEWLAEAWKTARRRKAVMIQEWRKLVGLQEQQRRLLESPL